MADILPFPEPTDPNARKTFEVEVSGIPDAHYDVVFYEGTKEVGRYPITDEALPELQAGLDAFAAKFAPAAKLETA
jgi:hypothetical protein